jgi:uncharacterized delta-60 repeat protein
LHGATSCAIERLENRQLMSAATLDPNFGNGGEVVTNFNAQATLGQDVATDASGRIIVAAQENNNVAVIRYLPTGALDPQFGSGGKAIVPLGQAIVRDMAIQTNGKILVSGSDGNEAFVVRLSAGGALDTTFGTGGKELFHFGTNNSADGVAELSSGKIYVATTGGTGANPTYILERLNYNGTKDTTFAQAGIASEPVGPFPSVTGLSVESNGRIVVGGDFSDPGSSGSDIVVFNATGTVYKQFSDGTDNALGGQIEAALAVQTDGKVVTVGQRTDQSSFFLERFTASGALDNTFGTGGRVQTEFGNNSNIAEANNVIVQPNGQILVVGLLNSNVEVVRYDANGSLDTTFGTNGKVSTSFGTGKNASADAVAFESSGRFVVAGQVETIATGGTAVGVVRYLGNHVELTSGQSSVTTGASVAADPRLAGAIVANQTLNFSFGSGSSAVHGQVIERVIKETTGGTLDFTYQIVNASGSLGSIASLIASNFAGFTTYVDYRPDSLGTLAPVTASRSADQKSVTFNFLPAPSGNGVVGPNKETFQLLVKTNATHFNSLGKVLLNNTASLAAYEPTT